MIHEAREFVSSDDGPLAARYALAVLPAAAAAVAARKGEYERVIALLLPARRNLWQMGGSHAQRDLFFQLLAAAAVKAGQTDVLAMLLEEIGAIGLEHLAERSSYADAVAMIH